MVTVYVLQSLSDNGYYIGITKEIKLRLAKHNKGGVHSTKRRAPFKLVHTEEFSDYKTAREREIEIKAYKGGNLFKSLIT